jgi:hypothetical protein
VLSETLKQLVDQQIRNPVSDSPFDQLDRVSDFYAAYILKQLRLRGDSRATDGQALGNYIKAKDPDFQDVTPRTAQIKDRQIVLYLQTHVHPGTLPNYMTGVRVRIVDAQYRSHTSGSRPPAAATVDVDAVRVLRLHPTRNYDLDSTVFGEDVRQGLALSGRLNAPLPQADVAVAASRNASIEAETRRRFIARIGKSASYADAASHTFGWNFYPSNLQVVRPSALAAIVGWLVGTPRQFEVKAYLEGGGRDCQAVLLVPSDLASFTCEAWSVNAKLDPDAGAGGTEEVTDGPTKENPRRFTVTLPPFDPLETVAVNVGVTSSRPVTPTARGSTTGTIDPAAQARREIGLAIDGLAVRAESATFVIRDPSLDASGTMTCTLDAAGARATATTLPALAAAVKDAANAKVNAVLANERDPIRSVQITNPRAIAPFLKP